MLLLEAETINKYITTFYEINIVKNVELRKSENG